MAPVFNGYGCVVKFFMALKWPYGFAIVNLGIYGIPL